MNYFILSGWQIQRYRTVRYSTVHYGTGLTIFTCGIWHLAMRFVLAAGPSRLRVHLYGRRAFTSATVREPRAFVRELHAYVRHSIVITPLLWIPYSTVREPRATERYLIVIGPLLWFPYRTIVQQHIKGGSIMGTDGLAYAQRKLWGS